MQSDQDLSGQHTPLMPPPPPPLDVRLSRARRQLAARLARRSQTPGNEQDEANSESETDNLNATEDNDQDGARTDEAEQHPPARFVKLLGPCDDWEGM